MDKKTLTLAVKEIQGKNNFKWVLVLIILVIASDLSAIARGQKTNATKILLGVTLPNTMVVFERGEGSSINLAGKSKG